MSPMWAGKSRKLLDTPTNAPTDRICRRFSIPNDAEWLSLVNGALSLLMCPELYRVPENGIGIDAVTAEFAEMFLEYTGYEFMIGAVFAMATDVLPANMLWCEGQTLQRVDYPDLYGRLHAAYKDSADEFHLPDLRSRMIMGQDDVSVGDFQMGGEGGSQSVTLTESELPSHSHSTHGHGTGLAMVGIPPDAFFVSTPDPLPAATGNTGGANSHDNMPPYHVLRFAMVVKERGAC